jgi:hypothetical protein
MKLSKTAQDIYGGKKIFQSQNIGLKPTPGTNAELKANIGKLKYPWSNSVALCAICPG